jgi:hypothetical protein
MLLVEEQVQLWRHTYITEKWLPITRMRPMHSKYLMPSEAVLPNTGMLPKIFEAIKYYR